MLEGVEERVKGDGIGIVIGIVGIGICDDIIGLAVLEGGRKERVHISFLLGSRKEELQIQTGMWSRGIPCSSTGDEGTDMVMFSTMMGLLLLNWYLVLVRSWRPTREGIASG